MREGLRATDRSAESDRIGLNARLQAIEQALRMLGVDVKWEPPIAPGWTVKKIQDAPKDYGLDAIAEGIRMRRAAADEGREK